MKKYCSLLFVFSLIGLFIFAGCKVNHSPIIKSIRWEPTTPEVGTTVTIRCDAWDEDGDPLTFEWKWVDKDIVFEDKDASITWTAPPTAGDYRFYVKVEDGRGGFADTTFSLKTYQLIHQIKLFPPDSIETRSLWLTWTPVYHPAFEEYYVLQSTEPNVKIHGEKIPGSDQKNPYITHYKVTSLIPGETYYFAIVAVDTAGKIIAYSNEEKATTLPFKNLGKVSFDGHSLRLAHYHNTPYTYVAAREGGVAAITVPNGTPTYITSYRFPPHYAYDISIYSNWLYVAFFTGGLHILDITSPSDPDSVGSLGVATLLGAPVSVTATAHRAYVGHSNKMMAIIDVTNKASPTVLDTVLLLDYPWDMVIYGNYLYIACGDAGLAVVDISTDKVEMGNIIYYTTADAAKALYLSGNKLFVAVSSRGLVVFDVSNPASPTVANRWPAEPGMNDARGVFVQGDWVYLADGIYGLRVLDHTTRPISLFVTIKVGDEINDVWVTTVGEERILARLALEYSQFQVIEF